VEEVVHGGGPEDLVDEPRAEDAIAEPILHAGLLLRGDLAVPEEEVTATATSTTRAGRSVVAVVGVIVAASGRCGIRVAGGVLVPTPSSGRAFPSVFVDAPGAW
jgi:hypothetical protein